jgi:hypothetical protein
MRTLFAACLLILLVAVGWLVATPDTSAQTPSPTPNPTQSPTPTPPPIPSSTITIRFVRSGQAVTIRLSQAINRILADGVQCGVGVLSVVVDSSGYSTSWPLQAATNQAVVCTKGPPTTLRFEFLSLDFGPLAAEFLWTGPDTTFDIEVPSATPVSTLGLGQLPDSGGPTPHRPAGAARNVIAGLAVILLIAVPLTAVTWRRS